MSEEDIRRGSFSIYNTTAPKPWRVDSDWTYEVIAADGTMVAQFAWLEEAYEFIDKHDTTPGGSE